MNGICQSMNTACRIPNIKHTHMILLKTDLNFMNLMFKTNFNPLTPNMTEDSSKRKLNREILERIYCCVKWVNKYDYVQKTNI